MYSESKIAGFFIVCFKRCTWKAGHFSMTISFQITHEAVKELSLAHVWHRQDSDFLSWLLKAAWLAVSTEHTEAMLQHNNKSLGLLRWWPEGVSLLFWVTKDELVECLRNSTKFDRVWGVSEQTDPWWKLDRYRSSSCPKDQTTTVINDPVSIFVKWNNNVQSDMK